MRFAHSASPAIISLLLTTATFATASTGSSTLVISEFRTRGPNGANDEFIELHNLSNGPVAIDGWKVMRSPGSSSSGSPTQVLQIPANTTMNPGSFFLLTNTGTYGYSGSVGPDATYAGGIDDDGGIGLLDATGIVIDQVGMSTNTFFHEGTPLAPMTLNVNQSYERNFGGCYPEQDTDNNSSDFRYNGSSSYAKDSTSNCSSCTNVTCQLPLSIQCWNPTGQCLQGACNYTQFDEGTPCNDGSACSTGEFCDASGQCGSGSPVTCNTPPAAYCSGANTLIQYNAGTCDPVQGCQYTPQAPLNCPYGCNSSTLACNPYPCSGPCTTPPTNGCYTADAGVCQNDGSCAYTYNPLGTACNDGNYCTTGETCDAVGNCQGGTAINIDDTNPCTVDTCDPVTGNISHAPMQVGSNCDDGDLCNGIATCQTTGSTISCVNGSPVACVTPSAGGCYASTGMCDPSTGICAYAFLNAGTSCDDGNPCTVSDQCNGMGSCSGSTKPCADNHVCVDGSTSRLYWSGSCNSSDGSCSYAQADTQCQLGCDSSSGLCKADPCLNVSCDSPSGSCQVGACVNGNCVYQLKPEGSACDDGSACTTADQCSAAGSCQGTPLACNSPTSQHACIDSTTSRSWNVNGACLSASGLCSYTYSDMACPNGCDLVTGLCVADPCIGVSCDQPPSQCYQGTGTCAGGNCSYALKPVNSACDDGNICTSGDVCASDGSCQGTPVVCGNPPSAVCSSDNNSSRTYSSLGTCNSLGLCDYAATNTACNSGCNSSTGLCNNDPCANVVCNQPPGACYADQGQCNGAGVCMYSPKPSSVTCNDGNSCTAQDACDGNGSCVGTAVPNCGSGGSSATGGNAATGGNLATGGNIAVSAGGSIATGGVEAAGGVLDIGGALSIGGVSSAGGSVATGGVTVASGGGATQTGGSSNAPTGGTATAGNTGTLTTGGTAATSQTGGSNSAGTSNNTGGSSVAATESTPADAGLGADSAVTNGGCSCSVPRSTSRSAWVVALLAVLTLRRRRRQ